MVEVQGHLGPPAREFPLQGLWPQPHTCPALCPHTSLSPQAGAPHLHHRRDCTCPVSFLELVLQEQKTHHMQMCFDVQIIMPPTSNFPTNFTSLKCGWVPNRGLRVPEAGVGFRAHSGGTIHPRGSQGVSAGTLCRDSPGLLSKQGC